MVQVARLLLGRCSGSQFLMLSAGSQVPPNRCPSQTDGQNGQQRQQGPGRHPVGGDEAMCSCGLGLAVVRIELPRMLYVPCYNTADTTTWISACITPGTRPCSVLDRRGLEQPKSRDGKDRMLLCRVDGLSMGQSSCLLPCLMLAICSAHE